MARKHYVIESKKKAKKEEVKDGKIKIIIDDVIECDENGIKIIASGKDIPASINKENRYVIGEWITRGMFIIVILLLLSLLAILALGKDGAIFENLAIDNIIGITALLFSISSIQNVKDYLSKRIAGTKIYKKMWWIVMILILPFYIVYVMQWLGLPGGISNICGLIGIFISILTW